MTSLSFLQSKNNFSSTMPGGFDQSIGSNKDHRKLKGWFYQLVNPLFFHNQSCIQEELQLHLLCIHKNSPNQSLHHPLFSSGPIDLLSLFFDKQPLLFYKKKNLTVENFYFLQYQVRHQKTNANHVACHHLTWS